MVKRKHTEGSSSSSGKKPRRSIVGPASPTAMPSAKKYRASFIAADANGACCRSGLKRRNQRPQKVGRRRFNPGVTVTPGSAAARTASAAARRRSAPAPPRPPAGAARLGMGIQGGGDEVKSLNYSTFADLAVLGPARLGFKLTGLQLRALFTACDMDQSETASFFELEPLWHFIGAWHAIGGGDRALSEIDAVHAAQILDGVAAPSFAPRITGVRFTDAFGAYSQAKNAGLHREEVAGAARRLFASIDHDGDGAITAGCLARELGVDVAAAERLLRATHASADGMRFVRFCSMLEEDAAARNAAPAPVSQAARCSARCGWALCACALLFALLATVSGGIFSTARGQAWATNRELAWRSTLLDTPCAERGALWSAQSIALKLFVVRPLFFR